jgi:hypothetical protein
MWGPGQATVKTGIWGEFALPPELLWAFGGLLAVLFAGAWVIVWASRWRKRRPELGVSAAEQLSRFRDLQKQGELSAAEFESIRILLEQKGTKAAAAPTSDALRTPSP